MKKLLLILLITLTTHTFSFAEDAQESDLTLGFLPYLSSQVLLKKYQPLVDYLSKELGRNVKIKIAKDYDAHLKATGKDELDISFLGGSPYVVVTDRYGKKPLLARYEFHDRPHFRSVFYTASNSDIKSLKDLKGSGFKQV
jgi:phosphonate transport system substrate-binding protein